MEKRAWLVLLLFLVVGIVSVFLSGCINPRVEEKATNITEESPSITPQHTELCAPLSCEDLNWECGLGIEPKCKRSIDCGSCEARLDCNNHQCVQKGSIIRNEKALSKYEGKVAFLVSDADWKKVLTLVPVAIWTGENNTVQKHPLLIYHVEEKGTLGIDLSATEPIFLVNGEKPDLLGVSISSLFTEKHITRYPFTAVLTMSLYNSSNKPIYIKNITIENWPLRGFLEPIGGNVIKIGNVVKPKEELNLSKKFELQYNIFKSKQFDIDSVTYFLQQYKPRKVVIVGDTPKKLIELLLEKPPLGAGLRKDELKTIKSVNHFDYWKEFGEVVLAEDDYETALLASSYASLINAPLVIKNYNDTIDLNGKTVICVGDVNAKCEKKLTLKELQGEYVKRSNANKIIVVNPEDVSRYVNTLFYPEKSGGQIEEIYRKTSLGAPILASAKHEVILPIKLEPIFDSNTLKKYNAMKCLNAAISKSITNIPTFCRQIIEKRMNAVEKVQKEISEKAREWGIKSGFLTIIATPDNIENVRFYRYSQKRLNAENADIGAYANIDSNPLPDLAVGRIYGLTTSDVSAYINRAIFFKELPKGESILYVAGNEAPDEIARGLFYELVFTKLGYKFEKFIDFEHRVPRPPPEKYENRFFIVYMSHATKVFMGMNSRVFPYFKDTYIHDTGCGTCNYFASNRDPYLVCVQAIRKGAIAHYGMAENGGVDITQSMATDLFQNKPLGQAWTESQMLASIDVLALEAEGKNHLNMNTQFALLADPTLSLDVPTEFPESTIEKQLPCAVSSNEDHCRMKGENPNYKVKLMTAKAKINFRLGGKQKEYNLSFISGNEKGTIAPGAHGATFINYFGDFLALVGPVDKGYNTAMSTVNTDDYFFSIAYAREVNEKDQNLWVDFTPRKTFINNLPDTNGAFKPMELSFMLYKWGHARARFPRIKKDGTIEMVGAGD